MNTRTTKNIAKVITLSLLTATALHATNGANLIGVGAKARAMGGTGIAVSHGAESSLINPAMITSVEGTQISFGGTLFMPDISTGFTGNSQFGNPGDGPGGPMTNPMNPGSAFFNQAEHRSDATRSVIPSVSIAHKINENWFVGIGMFGVGGMGTDYRHAGKPGTITPPTGAGPTPAGSINYANFNMITNLQLMQFAVPVAYTSNGFTIGVSAILQYGNLDINYRQPIADPATGQPTGNLNNVGNGLGQDFGLGWNAGVSYDFSNGLTLGAMYKSKIKMTYDGQISETSAPFGLTLGDSLDQPAEYGVGFAYKISQHTIAFDYKRIKWADTAGYGDFGWENQDVIAIGYEFDQDKWALRAGFNYGSSAVVEQSGATTPQGVGTQSALNFFNLLGFPATAEQHYTFGGTYNLTERFGIDLAYVYSPTVTKTFGVPAFSPPTQMGVESITNTHQEDSVSFQLTYNF